MQNTIFSGKVRARVCGLLIEKGDLLLLKHQGIGLSSFIWSPPGGGIEFGMSAEDSLIKEYQEETGLEVMVQQFLFVNEYIDIHHHAVELFFSVKKTGGQITLGRDPELRADQQILTEIRYFKESELREVPDVEKHNIFHNCSSYTTITDKTGYFRFINK